MSQPEGQDRSGGQPPRSERLGRRLATTPIKAGGDYTTGVVLLVLTAGCIALLVLVALPQADSGGGIAGSIALAVLALFFLAGGVSSIRGGMAVQGRDVHTHEHGLVAETKEGPLSLPYADLLVYRQQTNHMKGNTVVRTEVSWRVERRDGTRWEVGPASALKLADLYETVLTRVCERQAGPQMAALSAGSTLTFGDVSFDGHRLRAPGIDVAWADVKETKLANGEVAVLVPRDGRLVKELWQRVGPAGNIPNFPLFWALFQQAFANSRPGPSAGAGSAPAGPPTSATGAVHPQLDPSRPAPPTSGSSGAGPSGSRS